MTLKPPSDPNNPVENPDAALENAENEFIEPQVFSGAQMGVFMDFANGVSNVIPGTRDMGTPTRADNVTIGAAGALVYSTDDLECDLPRSLKFTTPSGSAGGYFTVNHPRNTTWPFYGRLYVRVSAAAPNGSIQAVRWFANGAALARWQINTSRKIEIRDVANALFATSDTVLTLGTTYRIEWEVVPGSPGSVSVSIYVGNEEDPLETITGTGIAIGSFVDQTRFGNANNVDMGATCQYYFGAFADCLRNAAGAYTGAPEPLVLWENPGTGDQIGGIDHDGSLFLCATSTFQYDSNRQKVKPGDVIFRVDPVKGVVTYGLNRNMAKTPTDSGSYFEGYHVPSGRLHAWSLNIDTINDPPDLTLRRAETISPERSGSDASTSSTVVTLPGVDFHPHDIGRVVTLDGTDYWVRGIIDSSSCTVDDVDDELVTFSTQSGLAWSMPSYPFPYTLSAGKGAVGQVRTKPFGRAFIRSGSDGVTNGTTTFTSATAAFTSADTNRGLMIGGSVSRIYTMTYVNATTVTLNTADAISASGQAWAICGGPNDAGTEIQFNPTTLGFGCDDGVMIFDDTQDNVAVPTTYAKIALADPTIFQGGSNNFETRDVWEVIQDGTVKVLVGDLYIDGVGKGVRLTSPNGSTHKTLTVGNSGGPLWGGSQGLPFIAARKTADETVNNSAVLQNDDHLFFSVNANEIWFVEAQLWCQSASATSDIQFGWSLPAGATFRMGRNSEFGVATGTSPSTLDGSGVAAGSVNGEYGVRLATWITVSSTAGTATLKWAQNTATAENTTVKTHSFLRAQRIA